jgi:hypothetical protein
MLQDKARKATGMQIDATEDGYTDLELFSLSSIKVLYHFETPPLPLLLVLESRELNFWFIDHEKKLKWPGILYMFVGDQKINEHEINKIEYTNLKTRFYFILP